MITLGLHKNMCIIPFWRILKHIHCDCGVCNFVVFQKVKYLWVLLSFSWKLCERTKAKQQRAPPLPWSALGEGSPGRADSTVSSIRGGRCSPLFLSCRCFRKGNVGGGLVEYSWLFPASVTFRSGVREKSPLLSFNSVNGHSLLVF